MKEIVRKATAFICFERPVLITVLNEELLRIHQNYHQQFPHWTYASSRKKLITAYWLKHVFRHFSSIIVLAILLELPFQIAQQPIFVPAMLAAFVAAPCLLVSYYGPVFYSEFLPMLDTIIEQQKTLLPPVELRKCKRSQFGIPTLTIIFYVFTKIAALPAPAANDQSAELLNNLYGADKDKLKQNLSRLYKMSSLSPKERAEMQKGIDAARQFFLAIDSEAAPQVLDHIECKLQQSA